MYHGASYAAFMAGRMAIFEWPCPMGDLLYTGAKDTISFLTANNVPDVGGIRTWLIEVQAQKA